MKKNHIVLAAAASAVIMVAPLALGAVNVFTPAQVTMADGTATQTDHSLLEAAVKAAESQKFTAADSAGGYAQYQVDRAKAVIAGSPLKLDQDATDPTKSKTPDAYLAGKLDALIANAVNSGDPISPATQEFLTENPAMALIAHYATVEHKVGPTAAEAAKATEKAADTVSNDTTASASLKAAAAKIKSNVAINTLAASVAKQSGNNNSLTGNQGTTTADFGSNASVSVPTATTKPTGVTPVKKNAGVTIKGVAKTTEGTPVYDRNFAATGRTLPKNTSWKVSNVTVAPNGDIFYKVGTNQYVRADAAKLNTNAAQNLNGDTSLPVKKVATVKYVPGYGIQVWKSDFKTFAKSADGSLEKLADKTSWKVSAIVKHNGHVFYRVGTDQYIDASYATLK